MRRRDRFVLYQHFELPVFVFFSLCFCLFLLVIGCVGHRWGREKERSSRMSWIGKGLRSPNWASHFVAPKRGGIFGQDTHFHVLFGCLRVPWQGCDTCHQIVPHTTRGGIFFRAESHFHIIFGLFTNSLCQLSPNCTSILAFLCR